MWSPTISSDELYHHGIRGQRWGRRNGPPYPLDAADHSASEKKAGYQKSIKPSGQAQKLKHNKYAQSWIETTSEDFQMKYDLSKGKANKLAEKDWETTKKVLIGAAVVAGIGLTAYGIHYIKKNNFDEVISAGTTIQTLSKDEHRLETGRQFYTNFKEKDKALYEAWFSRSGDTYKNAIQATAESDMKIASRGSSKKIFNDLMKNNPEFKEAVSTGLGLNDKQISGVRKFTDSYTYNIHDAFNTHILPLDDSIKWTEYAINDKQPKSSQQITLRQNEKAREHNAKVEALFKARDTYYEALLKKGYSGVIDINDQWYSNLRGQAPTIIFDKSKLSTTTTRSLSGEDVKKAHELFKNKYHTTVSAQAFVNSLNTMTMSEAMKVAGIGTVASVSVPSYVYDLKAKQVAKEEQKRKK